MSTMFGATTWPCTLETGNDILDSQIEEISSVEKISVG